MKLAASLCLAASVSACVMTPQRAASYSDNELCFNLRDQFSFTGNTERLLGAEVSRRGITCGSYGVIAGARSQEYEAAAARCRMNAAMLPRQPQPLTPPPNPGAGLVQIGQAMRDVATEQSFMADCMTSQGFR